MSTSGRDLDALFQSAVADGSIPASSIKAFQLVDAGAQIEDMLATSVIDLDNRESFVATVNADDSGSMYGFVDTVIREQNNSIDALMESHQRDWILFGTSFLHRPSLPYMPLASAGRLDRTNYDASGGTPLCDVIIKTLGGVVALAQEGVENGQVVRTSTLFISDGGDNASRAKPKDVKPLVQKMAQQEHIIVFLGIDDAPDACYRCGVRFSGKPPVNCPSCGMLVPRTDYEKLAKEMGFAPEWVWVPGRDPKELRKGWGAWTRSSVRASQGAVGFSQSASSGLGGFANP